VAPGDGMPPSSSSDVAPGDGMPGRMPCATFVKSMEWRLQKPIANVSLGYDNCVHVQNARAFAYSVAWVSADDLLVATLASCARFTLMSESSAGVRVP